MGRSTVSRVAKRLDGAVEALRSVPIEGPHPYLYLDATFLNARWARKVENVLLAEITACWHNELPEAMRVLERGFTAVTQFYAFPEPHWARLRTTNSFERLHTEIKRRIRSAGAFPDRASALRLIYRGCSEDYCGLERAPLPGPLTPRAQRRSPRQPNRSIEELPLTFTHNSGLDRWGPVRLQR